LSSFIATLPLRTGFGFCHISLGERLILGGRRLIAQDQWDYTYFFGLDCGRVKAASGGKGWR